VHEGTFESVEILQRIECPFRLAKSAPN